MGTTTRDMVISSRIAVLLAFPAILVRAAVTEPDSALLNPNKMLPETPGEVEKAYTRQGVLRSFKGDQCKGPSQTSTGSKYKACVKASSIEECPTDVWHKAFKCSSCMDEKKDQCSQKVLDVSFFWTSYNDQLYLRMKKDGVAEAQITAGKMFGKGEAGCLSWMSDIRPAILSHKSVWGPSCAVATPLGTDLGEADVTEDFLQLDGSFT